MALNTPLATGSPNLLTMLKAAIGDSLSTGTANDAVYKQRLSDKQQWLSGEYDFPFLTKEWLVNVGPGTRYGNFPVVATTRDGVAKTLDWNRPFKVEVLYANRWQEVKCGIDTREYNSLSSDNVSFGSSQVTADTLDPIQRYKPASSARFEVWPLPSTGQTLLFTGQMVLDALVANGDTADLDDELIVYSLAVEYLSKRKSADSQILLAVAQNRLATLRSAYPVRDESIVIGGSMDRVHRHLVPIIATH